MARGMASLRARGMAFGNAGRGTIEGPGYVLFNAGLQKAVRLERLGRIIFTASFQNVLNLHNKGVGADSQHQL